MEDFSQSRGDDDLFDDEIIPLDPSEIETVVVQTQDPPKHSPPTLAPNGPSQREYGPRGRGRGGRGRGNNELLNSRFAPRAQPQTTQTKPPPQQQPSVPDTSQEGSTSTTNLDAPTTTDNTENPESNVTDPPPPPAPAAAPTPTRTLAVRGDRTATGGIKKPKLTEDELTAKLAEAKERSQNLSAAHARAQADAASFEAREKIAQAKRAKDVANRKAMDTERAQNRLRKMAGMGGREWDSEKESDEFRGRGRGGGYMRGAHGGVRYDRERRDPALEGEDVDLRQYEWNGDRGRGRGGRGRGRGGYRGRGDARNGNFSERRQPDVSAEAEFPALPETAKPKNDMRKPPQSVQARTTSDALSAADGKETWADQVESSEAAKQT
jgi:hypothetical protein